MPTNKQKQYVRAKIVDKSSTEKQLLAKAGYSKAVQIKPTQVTRSKGVQELLAKAEAQGLTDESVINGIKEAIQAQFKRKKADYALRWLDLIYKQRLTQTNIQVNNYTQQDEIMEAIEIVNTGLDNKTLVIKNERIVQA